jgi:chemosensory pili system protein ChpA (sensor histidine kinase/response regulator)
MPDKDREFLLSVFLMEAWDTLATLEDGLGRLRAPEVSTATVEPLLVVSHRLKGAAALNGFPELAGVTETLERTLEQAPALRAEARGATADVFAELLRLLKRMLDGIGANGQEDAEAVAAFRSGHVGFLLAPTPSPAGGASGAPAGPRAEVERFFAENPDVVVYFRPEASEHLETMTQTLLALEQAGRTDEQLGSLFRAVHTLKGAAYTVGCTVVGDLVHRIEDLMVAVREDRVPLTPSVIETVLMGTDAVRLLLGLAESPAAEVDALVEAAVTQVGRLMPAGDAQGTDAPAVVAAASSRPASSAKALVPAERRVPAELTAPPRRSVATGPAVRVSLDRLDALMNLVGELGIARSRLDRRLAELDRAGELLLVSGERMARAAKDFEVDREAGRWTPRPATGADGSVVSPAGPTAGGQTGTDARPLLAELFDELEFDRYDDFDILARSMAELSADLTEVQTQVGGLIRTVREDTAQIQRLTRQLRTEITRARLVPVARLFARFGRQVREAARAAGKTVALEVSGETVELDGSIAEALADPLLHLVQNAITHGIESGDERQARGKPRPGTIRLRAAHRGGFVSIAVEDDGRGIDAERLKAAAARQGFLSSEAAAALNPREALDLMFLPGFSTAPVVTTGSGRGVGLDVVRTHLTRLGGEIDVETEPGAGSRFTLRLPLTVVISDALMVQSGAETLAIPVSAVRRVLTVNPGAIEPGEGTERVWVDDRMVDLVRLDRLLGLPPAAARRGIPVVVVGSSGTSLAVAVDELGGKEEIVIKSLGAFLQDSTPFAGATISSEGRVILLLDPARLVALAESLSRAGGAGTPAPAARPELARMGPAATAPRVLLVDDSVSVRRVVGHMLERAGFQVITANDGAEALRQLKDGPVHAVITDLEMPRVNGYELIEDLRRRPPTRDVPIVVLTTRAGDKHLTLARRLGVKHYVSKPVEEHVFVRLITSLTAPDSVAGELAGAAR